MTVKQIEKLVCKDTLVAWKSELLGDKQLEASISHTILMVLQSRQTDQDLVPCDFDICELRLATFEKIAGRKAV